MDNFSEISLELTRIIKVEDKKKFGIYFTPNVIVNTLLEDLKKYVDDDEHEIEILEPSVGSCNFIEPILKHFPNSSITGIEKNTIIYDKMKLSKYDNFSLLNDDFLEFQSSKKFNFILGNPPYFILTSEKSKEYVNLLKKQFHDVDEDIFKGKTNIFCFFLYKSLRLLKENGIMSFVIPSSILNTNSYGKLRKVIYNNYKILDIKIIEEDVFLETKQKTLIFTACNTQPEKNSKFVLIHKNTCVFTNEKKYFESIINSSRFLIDTKGINIHVGNIAWNLHKDELRSEKTDGVHTLLYNFNITENNSILINNEGIYNNKAQYIKTDLKKIVTPPAIVINRGNGNANLNLKFALIEKDFGQFYAENHLYVITGDLTKLKEIFESLKKEKTITFLNKCVPNNCLTKRDLEIFLPIE